MTDEHDLGITEVLSHRVHVRRVRSDVDLLAIHGQATAAVPAIVKMSNRQYFRKIVPEIAEDVAVARQAVAQERSRPLTETLALVLPDVEASPVAR
jgi:hypothetical protein